MPLAPDQSVSGTTDPRFAAVSDALREQLSRGEELGASLVVDVDGSTVVDIVCDLDRRTTTTYAMNRTAPGIISSYRSEAYVRAVYECLSA